MEETNIIIELAKQVPALGVLVYLVITFLKQTKETSQQFTSTLLRLESERHGIATETLKSNHDVQKETVKVVSQAAHSISANTNVLKRVEELLR